jgi:hypothetical protein
MADKPFFGSPEDGPPPPNKGLRPVLMRPADG